MPTVTIYHAKKRIRGKVQVQHLVTLPVAIVESLGWDRPGTQLEVTVLGRSSIELRSVRKTSRRPPTRPPTAARPPRGREASQLSLFP